MKQTFFRPGAAVIETLRLNVGTLSDFVAEIPAEELDVKRRPGFWSIRDHIIHLAEVQPMLHDRIRKFRDEEPVRITPYIPDGPPQTPDSDTATAIASLREWREKQLTIISSLPDSVWAKRAEHPEFKLYTALILIRHIAMHDHWHMYRMEELWITRDQFLTDVQ